MARSGRSRIPTFAETAWLSPDVAWAGPAACAALSARAPAAASVISFSLFANTSEPPPFGAPAHRGEGGSGEPFRRGAGASRRAGAFVPGGWSGAPIGDASPGGVFEAGRVACERPLVWDRGQGRQNTT